MKNTLQRIVANIEKVIVGKREVVELTVIALAADGHVLIEDIPGIGKTTLVKALAKSLDFSFGRIQCTPDVLPSDITGFNMFNIKSGDMEYKEGLVFNNIILADEINRASPKTQSSLLEVMEEGQVTIDGNTRKVPKPFMLLATQNPVEYLGTFPLPEAQMDRFMFKVSLGYPSYKNEFFMIDRIIKEGAIDKIRPVAEPQDMINIQKAVREVATSDAVKKYVLDIVTSTRKNPNVLLGASPRASIQLVKAAQAVAFFMGRDYVIPDDVQRLAMNVLAHRIILKPEAKIKEIKQEQIIFGILKSVKVPVE